MRKLPIVLAALALQACGHASPLLHAPHAPVPAQIRSAPLCALVGPHSGKEGVYGTDLGYVVESGTEAGDPLFLLFGDTWSEAGDSCRYPEHESDDLLAIVPHERPAQLPEGIAPGGPIPACGVLDFEYEDAEDVTSWKRMHLFQHKSDRGEAPAMLSMGMLRTPIGAFRTHGATYGVFFRNEPAPCQADGECPTGMRCSATLPRPTVGRCGALPGSPEGGARMLCRNDDECLLADCEMDGPGMCLSQAPFHIPHAGGVVAPAWYRDDPRKAVAQNIYLGRMVEGSPGDFVAEHTFVTNRFTNAAAYTVAHFDPEHPERNDYRPGHHTLLLFGRPSFVATDGAQSLPFLLYQRLPDNPDAPLQWDPRFFAGYDGDRKPRWTRFEAEAQPVYGAAVRLDDRSSPPRAFFERPEFDYVNQMSVTYVDALQRWVMLYGGDVPDFLVSDPDEGQRKRPTHPQPSEGAMHMRSAAHPWGAPEDALQDRWSDPVPVLTRRGAAPILVCPEDDDAAEQVTPGCLEHSDPADTAPLLSTVARLATELNPGAFFEFYAKCAVGEMAMAVQTEMAGDTLGRMYGASILSPWTEVRTGAEGGAEVDLYWAVSTWNPYEVFLVRTTLTDMGLPKK